MATEQTPSSPRGASGTRTGGVAQSAAERATEQTREAGRQAGEAARQATDRARTKARQEFDNRTIQVGERLSATAQDVRTLGEELRKQGKEGAAGLADQVAQGAERVAEYMKSADPDRMLGDAEDFARQRPWAVVAGGLVLGFAASRFIKASGGERSRSSRGEPSQTAAVPSQSPGPAATHGAVTATGAASSAVDGAPEVSPAPPEPGWDAEDPLPDHPTRSRPVSEL